MAELAGHGGQHCQQALSLSTPAALSILTDKHQKSHYMISVPDSADAQAPQQYPPG